MTAICAGGWSTEMAPEIPVILRRIEISVHGEAPVRATVSDAVTNVVTRPIASGGAWVVAYGGDVRYARRDDCDGLPDPAYEDAVRAALGERYPSIAGAPRIGGWAGAYDTTPDWNPAIGFLDDERYVVMGMSGHGLKLAPAVAECAAAQIAGREPPIDISPLRPQRFARGRPAAPRLRARRPRVSRGYSPAPMETQTTGSGRARDLRSSATAPGRRAATTGAPTPPRPTWSRRSTPAWTPG